jgi:MoxR-like ATPase
MTSDDPTLDEALTAAAGQLERVRHALRAVYQGPPDVLDLLLTGLLCRGHVLLEGVPGVAKTTLVDALARVMGLEFRRIQFTPDLLPSDITGSSIWHPQRAAFEFHPGPVFTQVVLADEINRAPARTQSALLEAMQEGQVSADGVTHPLPDPFFVLATQNPVEQQGVYPLPEAQLDRFTLCIRMGYPSMEQEVDMLAVRTGPPPRPRATLDLEALRALIALADQVRVAAPMQRYVVELARATRRLPSVRLGASPRASLALMRAARAHAVLQGRPWVHVDDIRALLIPVFRHRLLLQPGAQLGGTDASELLQRVLAQTRYERG